MASRYPVSTKSLRLIAVLVAGALLAAACSESAADDQAATEAGADADQGSENEENGPESESDEDGTDSGGSADENGSADDNGSAGGGSDPDFDYSTVDYDAEPVASALSGNRSDPAFPPPTIDPSLIRSGGPPPDGIPPIDNPIFIPLADVDYLDDEEAVVLVEVDGDARAYPVQILIWHEIVNDEFGDTPVTVTYCPLCNSALAFDRRLGDRLLDFGTSGELYQSALVMYDRQTGSLWAHFTGQGLVGHYAGAELDFVPAQTVSFAQFREAHPDGQVLSSNTGAVRDYGRNPYTGYDQEDSGPIGGFFNGDVDRTLLAKARIVGISDDAGSVAVRFEDLAEQPVIPVTEDGRNLVVFHLSGLSSALDDQNVAGGRDVGQTGVFVPEAPDGTALTFTADGDRFVDAETGSSWNIVGQAVDGPLAGQELTAVSHVDTFWFAWATYRPDTTIIAL